MIATVMLQVALPSPVVQIPNPVPPILWRSQHILEMSCDIAERKGVWQKIALKRTGGRAFQIDGEKKIRNTPLEWSLSSGDLRFQKPKFEIDAEKHILFSFPDRKWLWIYPNNYRFPPTYDQITIAYEDDLKIGNGRVFIGFCEVKRTTQEPISELTISKAEAEKYRDKRFQKQ